MLRVLFVPFKDQFSAVGSSFMSHLCRGVDAANQERDLMPADVGHVTVCSSRRLQLL